MSKFLIALFLLGFVAFFTLPVWAGGVVTLTATVTPQFVAIEIPAGYPTSVSYGVKPLGAVNQDPVGNPTLRVRNSGSVNENFHIAGYDATASGNTWTLSTTPGADQYGHKFSLVSPVSFHNLTLLAGDNELSHEVLPTETRDFLLRIDMPTSSSSYAEHSTTVNVVASAH